MSFLSDAFKGATNDFTANSAYAPGTQATRQDFTTQLNEGQGNYGQANTGFNTLAAALQQQMNGGGPNLANQNLQNFTGQNVASQAALMGGQRGAASNVGLMGRQIATQGANIQQQAAGQAASNVLAQQLAAQQQLGNVYGAQAGAANQNLGINQGAQTAQNQNIVSNTQGINQAGMSKANMNAGANQQLIGGIANAGMAIAGFADGGGVGDGTAYSGMKGPVDAYGAPTTAQFGFEQNFTSGSKPKPMGGMAGGASDAMGGEGIQGMMQGITQAGPMLAAAKGGEMHLPFRPHDYRQGGQVKATNPQEKATVQGNSYANDKIPAMVSEGEVVIPRDIMQHPNAPQLAMQFVQNILSKKGG